MARSYQRAVGRVKGKFLAGSGPLAVGVRGLAVPVPDTIVHHFPLSGIDLETVYLEARKVKRQE